MNLNTLGPSAPVGDDVGESASLLGDIRSSGDDGSGVPDLSTAAAPRRRLSTQNLIIVLTLVASAGALFMMRQQGKSAGVTFQKVSIDVEPENAAVQHPDQARILADLARSTQLATAPEKLETNPFKFDAPPPAPGAPAPVGADPELERARTLLASMEINAIMLGSVPVARINGRLVRVGDTLDGVLLIAQINDRSVDVIVHGKTHTVTMGEGTSGVAPRPGTPAQRPPHPFGPPPGR